MQTNSADQLTTLTFSKLSHLSYRSGELKPYLDTICESIIEILGEGVAAVTLLKDNKKHVLSIVPKERHKSQAQDAHGFLSTYVVTHQQILNVEDATKTPQYGTPPAGFCSYLGVPLKLPNGEIVGTLCYFNEKKRQFTPQEQQVSELFAERAAVALDNYQQYQQLKDYSHNLEEKVKQGTETLLEVRQELAHKEKLAAVGEFASRITHEVRNPLATIALALDYLQKNDDINSQKRAVLAANEVKRLENLLNEVLLYARPVQLSLQTINLSSWLDDFLMTYDSLAEKSQLSFKYQQKKAIPVQADPDKLTQICLNLLRNACEASSPQSEITWNTEQTSEYAIISIHNSGETIPAAKLAGISEPFVSAKAGGSGLGLAIVKSLVTAHQGELTITSTTQLGTTVTVKLPITTT